MAIRTGGGTGIEAIRLGDGTEIVEVRRGDGTVLWTAEPAIPDSDAYRYLMGEGDGSTVTDTSTGSTTELTLTSEVGWNERSDAIGGWATTFDGVGGSGQSNTTLPANGNEFTAVTWVELNSIGSNEGVIKTSGGIADWAVNGWSIRVHNTGGGINLYFADSDSRTQISQSDVDATNEWLFIAVTGNGSAGTLDIWNVTEKLFSGSGSGSRATGDQEVTIGVTNSNWQEMEMSYTQAWQDQKTQSELANIWSDTRDIHM